MAKRYHHGEVRSGAVAAALAITEADGPDAVTMRAVANRVGVDHRAIYRHFTDRDRLLAEVAADGFRDLLCELVRAEGEAGLQRDFTASIRFALARPHLYALMLSRPRELMFDGAALEAAVRAMLEHLMASARLALGDEVEARICRDLVFSALGASYGLVSLASSMTLAPRSPAELEAFLTEQVAAVIEGQLLRLRGPA
ncbi:TetR/AcrR family transcriptional regulator [Maricaulis sp.]|uniref:TetR/AcrR family transcriptional regulator n=1 Tax=Maricaulis sp. TaxID=1486257 RepID=UPI001B081F61|nr:TetR/AcrR family transcriptional regulator [Maricaulis sp.]MBO6797346.1 helix-turn-helix transcriptional regulator [Maricaulis sp.]